MVLAFESKARMSKRLKKAAELVALLNSELRKQDACAGVSVDAITPVADPRVTWSWTATALRRRAVPCQDNAPAFSSRRCACFNNNTIWHLRIDVEPPYFLNAAPLAITPEP